MQKRYLNGKVWFIQGGDDAKDKASPLHLCCQWGLVRVLQTLIDHGANVNALDSDNKTPLHIAIENQHEEIIKILLCHPNIDLKIRDKAGNTCFATALTFRNHKAAQSILERLPNAAEQMVDTCIDFPRDNIYSSHFSRLGSTWPQFPPYCYYER